jgi:hypothetical protein
MPTQQDGRQVCTGREAAAMVVRTLYPCLVGKTRCRAASLLVPCQPAMKGDRPETHVLQSINTIAHHWEASG